jgi:prepilin-type N-terminal cleavage/methylation domain-containing protein
MNRNKKIKGFTFIEVLTVVMIIAVLVGASLPAYLWTRDDARARKKQAAIQRVIEAKIKFYNAEKTAAALGETPTLEQIANYLILDPTERPPGGGPPIASTNVFFSNSPESIFKNCFPPDEIWKLDPKSRSEQPVFVKIAP